MSESTSAFLCGLGLGFIITTLAALTVHNTAIKKHQFRGYKQWTVSRDQYGVYVIEPK